MSAVSQHLEALEEARGFMATLISTGAARHIDDGALEALDQVIEDLRTEAGMRQGEENE